MGEHDRHDEAAPAAVGTDPAADGDVAPPAVRRSVDLDAGAAEVWDALTRPERLADWFEASEVTFVAEPGAPARFVGVDGEERSAVVEDVVPERRLVFRWWPDGEGEGGGASRVELDLTPSPLGTRLTVVEAPLPRSATVVASAGASTACAVLASGTAWAWRLGMLQIGLWSLART